MTSEPGNTSRTLEHRENVVMDSDKTEHLKEFVGVLKKDVEFRADLRKDRIVNEAKMRTTNDAIFMRCLPVRRNVIVTDAVIDSANSVVLDEAENRLRRIIFKNNYCVGNLRRDYS